MINFLLGIVIGISLSTCNILVYYIYFRENKTEGVSQKVNRKIKKLQKEYNMASIVDMTPEVELD